MMPLNLLSLPSEIVHGICSKVEPEDLAQLSRTCHRFNDFIRSDWLISKNVFLQHFDDPRIEIGASDKEPSWEIDLHSYVKVGKILASQNAELKQIEAVFVTTGIALLVQTSRPEPGPSRNLRFIAQHFRDEDQQNKEIFLSSSSLFTWARKDLWQDAAYTASLLNHTAPSDGTASCQADRTGESDLQPTSTNSNISPIDSKEQELSRDMMSHNEEYDERQMLSAKLHCLYGVPLQEVHRGAAPTETKSYSLRNNTFPLHPFVRSRVYDLRQHTKNHNASFWGPYIANGTQEVDWEKLEAIMVILHHNMSHFARSHDVFPEDAIPHWKIPFKGASSYSYRSKKIDIPVNPPIPLEAQDPYNVSGTWMRVVCFLDYTELYDFNFGQGSDVHPDAPRRKLDSEEATRLITMRIQVTKITPPGEDEGQALPVVHFKGTSSSVRPSWDPNANSEIKEQGTVKLTPQGEVRWTTWSIFHGEERWRSEGIQIGGPQSERGVLGFWFDKDYDIHGPAGPTAFWKSHDGIEKRRPPPSSSSAASRTLDEAALHALHVPLY